MLGIKEYIFKVISRRNILIEAKFYGDVKIKMTDKSSQKEYKRSYKQVCK